MHWYWLKMKPMTTKTPTNGNNRKFRAQSLALFIALAAPFGIYIAIQAGLVFLAGLFSALLVFSMALTIWKG